jgi:hypothetical protein
LQVTAFIPGGGGYQTFFQFFNIPISPCVWSVIDNLRGFAFCNNAVPQAGASISVSTVANGIIKTPGVVFPTSGLLNTSPPAGSNPGAITDPFAEMITGIDFLIAGDTGDANTMLFATINQPIVANIFGGNSADAVTIGLPIDVNGNNFTQWRVPGNQPGIYTSGFNGINNIIMPALTTAPLKYSVTVFYKQM